MTHIFIVNEQTFKIHLEYMFAGTGYGENEPDFIDKIKLNSNADKIEKTYVEMIADISKVRPNDKIAFYVTGCKKIFGFFKVVGLPFFVAKQSDNLFGLLNKYLPLRIKIEAEEVFGEGITEIEALDEILDIQHPYQMCWSLIYRKLTGMRGCSFVTDYEYNILRNKLIQKNNGILQGNSFSYEKDQQKIVKTTANTNYNTTNIDLDIQKRLLSVKKSFERHLQAYIIQNYDKNPLKNLLLPEKCKNNWIGNEVVCSVGEQRIDILIISETKEKYQIRIIELKDGHPNKNIVDKQFVWYIKWVQQYIAPNLSKPIEIIPTIIASSYKINCKGKREFFSACDAYNENKPFIANNTSLNPVEYIKFVRNTDNISFEKVF